MNKAFVKEPDDTGACRCPRCGSLGIAVSPTTLAAQLGPELIKGLAESAFFCPFPRCEVAYFDMFERTVEVSALPRTVYPKDPSAPICGCFGLTCDEIEQDVREGVVTRCKDILTRSKTPEANCQELSPSGQCCAAEVQRYYMKFRQSWRPA